MQRRTINLTFHGIGPRRRALEPGEDRVWVSRERFEAVLDAVAGRDDIHITFDDGNRSDLEIALPGLLDRGLSGTFFVIAGRLDTPEHLSTTDVRALADAGMTIGCHGMRHRNWRKLTAATVREELVDARRILEAASGRSVVAAACPYGSYDRKTLKALANAGYARVYTSDRGAADADAWLQARTTITEGGSLEPILAPTPLSRLQRVKLAVKRWR